jgi:murein DD-endopeptidase MepM/ murein hydrolase activator NlpD
MSKIKYFYNTETCQYEKAVTKTSDVLVNILAFVVLSFIFSIVLMGLYFNFFDSPKESMLKEENQRLKGYYNAINKQVSDVSSMLVSLKDRDNQIYRVIFEAEPDDKSKIDEKEISSIQSFTNLLSGNIGKDGLLASTIEKIVDVQKKLYSQKHSYDEILKMALQKEEMLASIPAIQPISNKTLKALASGYGMRIHPIYKVRKFHAGIDFSAVRGTPIYATGNGIAHIPYANDGYGNHVEIEHGYGYMTRYGHLDKIKIKNGQKVKRGEVIGYVGSTGAATSPHLHYEVHKNGQTVDPIHFFFNDLSPKEFEELVKLSSVENQSLGGI